MKKFLVANCIGGAQITKQAWDYLVYNYIEFHNDEYMYYKIWSNYFEKHGSKDEDGEYVRFHPWREGSDEFRQILLNLVEELHYDYKKLDELNNGHDLRIITVPDDGLEYQITEDPECGAEYVTQVHRSYVVNDNWYERAKYLIKDFCNTHEDLDKITYVVELDKVRLVFDGDYAMAQCKAPVELDKARLSITDDYDLAKSNIPEAKNVYFLLKKTEYYKATDEHPKISYDILNEPTTSNYFGGMYRELFKQEDIESYFKLFRKLN